MKFICLFTKIQLNVGDKVVMKHKITCRIICIVFVWLKYLKYCSMYSTENEEQPSSSVTFVQLGSDPVNSGASGGAVGSDPIVNMTPDQISQLENVLRSENLIEGKR